MALRDSGLAPSPVFVLFFVGVVLLLVVTTALGIGAVRYEFSYTGTVDEAEGVRWRFDYEDLSAEDKRVVQRAMEGERFVFEDEGALPGPGRGDIAIRYQNEWHGFERRTYFEPKTAFGAGAIASALAGVACIGESIRRKRGD
ncbi:hypothetical protein [Haloarchaeobius iranensis]|uniref:DUF7979 domain-containing protein n=1 Tax=Haloarchaeobius iranensis TaxID=996166 RepID=A0A1G9VLM4_9EURY|nr:hypothetical protein [Haloarchaeobius iranensis]SDM73158.1 hypothetical protein SAMN05192554_106183 [Haloarchaeobius iranensis]